jgi:cell wall-associated NlpC family hydrolase
MYRSVLYLLIFAVVTGCATAPPAPPRPETRPVSPERAEALLQALLTLGVDYRNGGNSPASGFDCSGLPHNAQAQSELGVRVSLSELRAGDLVFYNTLHRPFSHVGIYVGDGRFVHAPKSGAQVRVESVTASYWAKRFDGARRIQPQAL